MFKVGDKVRAVGQREVGEVYRVNPGKATGRIMYSVVYTGTRNNPGHAFYYAEEIERVED